MFATATTQAAPQETPPDSSCARVTVARAAVVREEQQHTAAELDLLSGNRVRLISGVPFTLWKLPLTPVPHACQKSSRPCAHGKSLRTTPCKPSPGGDCPRAYDLGVAEGREGGGGGVGGAAALGHEGVHRRGHVGLVGVGPRGRPGRPACGRAGRGRGSQ